MDTSVVRVHIATRECQVRGVTARCMGAAAALLCTARLRTRDMRRNPLNFGVDKARPAGGGGVCENAPERAHGAASSAPPGQSRAGGVLSTGCAREARASPMATARRPSGAKRCAGAARIEVDGGWIVCFAAEIGAVRVPWGRVFAGGRGSNMGGNARKGPGYGPRHAMDGLRPWGYGPRHAMDGLRPWGYGPRHAMDGQRPWGYGPRRAMDGPRPWGYGAFCAIDGVGGQMANEQMANEQIRAEGGRGEGVGGALAGSPLLCADSAIGAEGQIANLQMANEQIRGEAARRLGVGGAPSGSPLLSADSAIGAEMHCENDQICNWV